REMREDRRKRRRVLLDLWKTLVRAVLLISAGDRVEVRIAEERTPDVVDDPVLELSLRQSAGRGAGCRRRSRGRDRRERRVRNGGARGDRARADRCARGRRAVRARRVTEARCRAAARSGEGDREQERQAAHTVLNAGPAG